MKASAALALILPVAGLAAGWLVSTIVTPRYVVTARLGVGDSFSPSLNGSEYLTLLEKDVLGDDSLSTIIENPGVDSYQRERARLPIRDLVAMMRRNVAIEPESSAGSYIPFRISYTYSDPLKTELTTRALIDKFVQWNRFHSTEPLYEKHANKDGRLDRLESRLAAIERRLGIPAETAPRVPVLDTTKIPGESALQAVQKQLDPRREPLRFTELRAPRSGGVQIEVIDAPGRAVKIYPNVPRFMAIGLVAGLMLAATVASIGRRSPVAPLLEQTA